MTIPTIADALRYLGLTLDQVHHYTGKNHALTVVTNDAKKYTVTMDQVKSITALYGDDRPQPELTPIAPIAHTRKIRRRAGQ